MEPRGRHALVTGASSGIGRAVAVELARRGAKLTLAARRTEELEATAAECRRLGAECRAISADVSAREDCFRLARDAAQALGPVEVLVNNAGYAIFDSVAEAKPADAEGMMRTNYLGMLWCIQAVLPSMLERAEGSIVNVGSITGLMGYGRMGAYCASKFAVTGLTEALRSEVIDRGISVSLVCPGTTDTPFFLKAERGKMPAANRLLLAIPPDRVASAVVKAVVTGRARIILPRLASVYMRLKEVFPGPAHFLMRRVSAWIERKDR